MTTNRKCEICNTRPVGNEAKAEGFKYCDPCYTEANWENTHSDYGHDDIDTYSLENTTFKVQAEVDRYISDTKVEMASCWICHPELNEATAAYTPRTGTPRTDAANTPHRSHAACNHPATPKARAACRKAGGPKV
jgi:hypothetical protein